MFFPRHRRLVASVPPFLPKGLTFEGVTADSSAKRLLYFFLCLFTVYGLTLAVRLLEIPYWQNPAYMLGDEYLLATHDAYHWIAGAEGFEFGAGHPMSRLVVWASELSGLSPANAGFWLPAYMGGLLAVGVFLWAWGMGYPYSGITAGVLASLAPGYFARTLLGFCDTDLVVLLFAVLMGLVPALWLNPWLVSPLEFIPFFRKTRPAPAFEGAEQPPAPLPRCGSAPVMEFGFTPEELRRAALSPVQVCLLSLSGAAGFMMQEWHSLFPYLLRWSLVLLPTLILVLAPKRARKVLLRGALCHLFPLYLGWWGLFYAALVLVEDELTAGRLKERRLPAAALLHNFLWGKRIHLLFWAVVLLLAVDRQVFSMLWNAVTFYFGRADSGAAGLAAAAASQPPLVFPAGADSVIEMQPVKASDLLLYFHPNQTLVIAGLVCFAVRLLRSPVMLWHLPLAALGFLSLEMGGRMTMFAPPAVFLGLGLEGGLLLEVLWFRLLVPACRSALAGGRGGLRGAILFLWNTAASFVLLRSYPGPSPAVEDMRPGPQLLRCAAAIAITVFLGRTSLDLIPAYTQGPILSREHAEALQFLRTGSPETAVVWDWWDWGYAAHHFARRAAIADGARHSGALLYLPAAVYTTADPRFARQLIKYTASKKGGAAEVFAGLSGPQAQALLTELADRRKPLVQAEGKQYLVVSLDLMRLGLWVTRFGSWSFAGDPRPDALVTLLDQGLRFNMDTGAVQPESGDTLYAGSIDLFSANSVERRNYNRYGGYHFVFNLQSGNEEKKAEALAASDSLARFWKNRLGYFAFNAAADDKLLMDDVYYNTMLVQLLLCSKDDPRISPYFTLVFDNTYARVYEVK